MKKLLLVLVLGAGIGAVAVPGSAQDAVRMVLGSYISHQAEERVDISVGVTRSGEPLREERLVEVRDVIVVPRHFGDLVSVTASGESAVLWYRNEDGEIRNVIVLDGMIRTYRIQKATSKIVADLPRPLR